MTSRFLIVPAVIAISAAFIGAAAAPAMAADISCARAPTQIRTLAVTTSDADSARKALSLVNLGEKLCDANARSEASKKFSAAAKLLGTDLAAMNVAPTAQ